MSATRPLGYFPGCSLHATAAEFDLSVKALCRTLGMELREVEKWICCGATPAHLTNEDLGLGLPYANLALAEEQGMTEVLTPCAARRWA